MSTNNVSKYCIFFRYGRGETYDLYWIGNSLSQGKKQYNKEVEDFYSWGLDDESQLWFVKFKNLSTDIVSKLESTDPEIKNKTLEEICLDGKSPSQDSFGYDGNESQYLDEVFYRVDGPDGFVELIDSFEDGSIQDIRIDPYDPSYEVSEQLSMLDENDFRDLVRKYCLPF